MFPEFLSGRGLNIRRVFTLAGILAALALSGCGGSEKPREVAYVSVPQTFLRDRVAPVYNKTATLHNAERVEVLDRKRRFALVRTQRGEEGWIQERYLVSQLVFEVAQKLPQTTRSMPVQARAVTRGSLNLHIQPGRDTDHVYQLKEGEKVEVLKRVARAKPQASRLLPVSQPDKDDKEPDAQPAEPGSPARAGVARAGVAEPAPLPMEDWLLVRDNQGHAGWVLARMLFIDAPLEIAQYAEGDRIAAYFVLNEVLDGDKKVPQYLVLLTGQKDGLPHDFDQARVFSWNVKRHRYETAYRERKLNGIFPARVDTEDFGSEGRLPVFVLPVRDEQGSVRERKYKLIGPIVRRVLAPGEEIRKAAAKTPATPPSRRRPR